MKDTLYSYVCPCHHHGQVRLSGDTHEGEIVECPACGAPVPIEWDGGTTL